MRKYHPDANASADATAKAAAINDAFSVLSDPVKRAAYDRDRMAAYRGSASAKSKASPPSPPPPPPTPHGPPAGNPGDTHPWAWFHSKRGEILGGAALIITLLVLSVLGAQSSGSSDANFAATDLGNVEDMNLSDLISYEPSSTSEFLNSVDTRAEIFPSSSPPPALEYADIQHAAQQFDATLRRSGIAGARVASERCHSNARRELTWSAFDRCAAFDFAASYIDLGMVAAAGVPRSAYFEFMESNAADQYQPLTTQSYSVSRRLEAMRRAVRPVITEIIQARTRNLETDVIGDQGPPGDVNLSTGGADQKQGDR